MLVDCLVVSMVVKMGTKPIQIGNMTGPSASGQREANIKVYVSEMIMPFWVQYTLCSKWRELNPQQEFSTEDIKTWKCTSSIDAVKTKTKVRQINNGYKHLLLGKIM